jgi:hypothetical protein
MSGNRLVELQQKKRVIMLELPPWPLLPTAFITGVSTGMFVSLDGVVSCASSFSVCVVSTGACVTGDSAVVGRDGVSLGGGVSLDGGVVSRGGVSLDGGVVSRGGVVVGVLIGDVFLPTRDLRFELAMVDGGWMDR